MSWIANFMENDMTVTDGVVTLNQYNPFCYFVDYRGHWWTNGLMKQCFIGCNAPIKPTLGRYRWYQNYLKQLMVWQIQFFRTYFHHLMEFLNLIEICCRVYFLPVRYWVAAGFHSGKWSDWPSFGFFLIHLQLTGLTNWLGDIVFKFSIAN